MNPFIRPAEQQAYASALHALDEAGVEFAVGGAYAMFHYSGMVRHTKDLDLFLRRADEPAARRALDRVGFRTEIRERLWLSKAFLGDVFVDLIYSSGNGIAAVDDAWLSYAPPAEVLGVPSRLVPPEEMIWSKAFVQERERWDGADVSHLLCSCGRTMDWERLMTRFEPHWQVLLAHLSLFSFTYPHDRGAVPAWVWRELLDRAEAQRQELLETEKLCRGTLLSRTQYMLDIGLWGYRDARETEVPGYLPEDVNVCAPFPTARNDARADEEEPLVTAGAAALAPEL